MYIQIGEELLKKASDITKTDYEPIIKDIILSDNAISMIEDLVFNYNLLKEEIDDLKQSIKDDYELKELCPYEEYGISENDFH